MSREPQQPDFASYHQSVAVELDSLKDRIRHLVPHWPTDGEFKETVLRTVLRRHVPETIAVGRGFVVTPEAASSQIDLLLVDRRSPTLFKDGDLMIVTPDAVRGIIEVKTELRRSDLEKVLTKLAQNARLCSSVTITDTWTGLFVYEEFEGADEDLLSAVGEAWITTRSPVDCISIGANTFIRYWDSRRGETCPSRRADGNPFWRSYELPDLAPGYFIGNLLHVVSPRPIAIPDERTRSLAWFPMLGGKEGHARYELVRGQTQPTRLAGDGGNRGRQGGTRRRRSPQPA